MLYIKKVKVTMLLKTPLHYMHVYVFKQRYVAQDSHIAIYLDQWFAFLLFGFVARLRNCK